MNFENTKAFAQNLDEKDELKNFRSKFFIPQQNGTDCIYFAGNSLGLQPKKVKDYLQQELDDWASMGVEGHFNAANPWMPYHEIFPKQVSKIVGCLPHETVVMNSLTVNLHLLMVSFYRPSKQRYKIICEAKAFPSDQYALESQVFYHACSANGGGYNPEDAIIELEPREGEYTLRTEDIISTIQKHSDSLALVMMGGVNYYTGQFYNLEAITKAAHDAGAFAGFDIAHAAGNVELKLHEWNVDFACWCSYKYLNSGPGGVSAVYINEKHAAKTSLKEMPRFAGWWGHNKEVRFKMEKGFDAIPTAEAWQLSNAPVLSMAAHKASLDIFEEAGMEPLHKKRKLLNDYLFFIIDECNAASEEKVIDIITPANKEERGCQVSMIMRRDGRKFFDALFDEGIIADWREPDVIRIAPVPLYNSYEDVWRFGEAMKKLVVKS